MKKYVCPTCSSRYTQPYCPECEKTIPSNSFVIESDAPSERISYCPNCDSQIKGNKLNCPYCGELLLKGNEGKYHYVTGSHHSEYSSTQSYTLQYVLSVLVPLVGFIMGAIYITKPDTKSIGGNCIILGIVSIIVCSFLGNFVL